MGIRQLLEVFTSFWMRITFRAKEQSHLTPQEYLPSPLQGLDLATKSRNKSARFLAFVSQSIFFETGGDRAGGYTNDPKDSGGETKWGISKRAHPHLTIKDVTYKQAVDIYEKTYYNSRYDYILDDKLAFKLFDMGILNGPKRAITHIQRAVNNHGLHIYVDGSFGPLTLTAINNIDRDFLYDSYIRSYTKYFKRISSGLFLKNRRFLKGWLRRLNWEWKI
jgi:lysozyme family protein